MNLDKKGNIANECTVVKNDDVDKVIAERWKRGQFCYKKQPLTNIDGSDDTRSLLYFKRRESDNE